MATTKVGIFHDPRKRKPWVVRWFGEFDPTTGKQRRYSRSFRLKRDAERFQAAKHAEFDKGAQRDRLKHITLGDFCGKYMERRRHEWREKTRLHIEDLCNRLEAYFGSDYPLQAINPDQASRFWSRARSLRPGYEGDELSRFSRNRVLRDSKTMFKHAVEWGDLMINPFANIRLMRVGKHNRKSWHFIKPAEYVALLKAAPTLRWKVFYALAYTSAARFGELFNLTEDDIDFARGKLLIRNREASPGLPPFRIKDHEEREIPLPKHALKLVAGWIKCRPPGSPLLLLTPERYARLRERWDEHRKSGKPWVNDYMVNNTVRDIRGHAKKAGLKLEGSLTMHCLRKSCGQNWANHLPMNVVKELMGHADIGTTAEFYSTVTEDHEAKAQWVIEAITVGRAKRTDARLTPDAKITPIRRAI